jgi:hypothetical protein
MPDANALVSFASFFESHFCGTEMATFTFPNLQPKHALASMPLSPLRAFLLGVEITFFKNSDSLFLQRRVRFFAKCNRQAVKLAS